MVLIDLTRQSGSEPEPAQAGTAEQTGARKSRVDAIDIARGVALLAMAIYHFGWDLDFFGYMEPGTTAVGGWRLFARSIASSFLFLVGVSLCLAHGAGLRWWPYARRLAMIAAAAAAISAATWFMPGGFIFFGILHQIALASVLGLAFLRLPAWLVLLAAAGVVATPHFLRMALFDHPALWWVGLSTNHPRSNDYVPLFPWFGAVLAGIGVTKIALQSGFIHWLARLRPGAWKNPFIFLGRHSLAFYLIHQPVLISCVWVFAQLWPAPALAPEARVMGDCNVQCTQSRDAAFCTAYCACVLDTADREGRLPEILSSRPSRETQTRLSEITAECSMKVDLGMEPTQ